MTAQGDGASLDDELDLLDGDNNGEAYKFEVDEEDALLNDTYDEDVAKMDDHSISNAIKSEVQNHHAICDGTELDYDSEDSIDKILQDSDKKAKQITMSGGSVEVKAKIDYIKVEAPNKEIIQVVNTTKQPVKDNKRGSGKDRQNFKNVDKSKIISRVDLTKPDGKIQGNFVGNMGTNIVSNGIYNQAHLNPQSLPFYPGMAMHTQKQHPQLNRFGVNQPPMPLIPNLFTATHNNPFGPNTQFSGQNRLPPNTRILPTINFSQPPLINQQQHLNQMQGQMMGYPMGPQSHMMGAPGFGMQNYGMNMAPITQPVNWTGLLNDFPVARKRRRSENRGRSSSDSRSSSRESDDRKKRKSDRKRRDHSRSRKSRSRSGERKSHRKSSRKDKDYKKKEVSKSKTADTTRECAKAIGVDDEYLKQLEKQQKQREELLRKKHSGQKIDPSLLEAPTLSQKEDVEKNYLVVTVEPIDSRKFGWKDKPVEKLEKKANEYGKVKKIWEKKKGCVCIIFKALADAQKFSEAFDG
uniref:RRM domain-containing protein n=1 Tax=Rhabditophanes sp. KR3021 TaxID=114890 RepID=A0AC35TPZ7_9BILA